MQRALIQILYLLAIAGIVFFKDAKRLLQAQDYSSNPMNVSAARVGDFLSEKRRQLLADKLQACRSGSARCSHRKYGLMFRAGSGKLAIDRTFTTEQQRREDRVEGDYGLVHIGLDRQFESGQLIGVYVGKDWSDSDTRRLGETINVDGDVIGIYGVAQLDDNMGSVGFSANYARLDYEFLNDSASGSRYGGTVVYTKPFYFKKSRAISSISIDGSWTRTNVGSHIFAGDLTSSGSFDVFRYGASATFERPVRMNSKHVLSPFFRTKFSGTSEKASSSLDELSVSDISTTFGVKHISTRTRTTLSYTRSNGQRNLERSFWLIQLNVDI